jgi:excisionase family DNA binding protein
LSQTLSVREVAARLGHEPSVVYALCEAGVLPHVRVNNSIRVLSADVAALIASRRRGGR